MATTVDITFCAEASLIEAARLRAMEEQISLDEAFHRWLEDYAGCQARETQAQRALDTLQRLREKVDSGGRRFTREEMNERTSSTRT